MANALITTGIRLGIEVMGPLDLAGQVDQDTQCFTGIFKSLGE